MEDLEFSEWISQKYINWRGGSIGHDGTVTEFAAQIGVGRSLVTQWMKKGGKVPTSKKAIDGLVKLFGDEVYSILGLIPLDMPITHSIPFDALPSEFREQLSAALVEINAATAEKQIKDPESPEALELARRIFSAHGFKVEITTE